MEALAAVSKERPDKPVTYLIEYLEKNNTEK
jgi:hypothetical protein